MAEVRLLREGLPDLLPMQGRSPGVHVSTCIKNLATAAGYLTDKVELSTTWAQLGCALEHAIRHRYTLHYPGRYVEPGEFEVDGLFGTPDVMDLDPLADPNLTSDDIELIGDCTTVLEEIKLAWISSRHTPRDCVACPGGTNPNPLPACKKYWRYEVQLKAYCYAFNTHVGKLNVTHVQGDWKHDGPGPANKPWLFRFTDDELQQNWRMLLKEADRIRNQQEG